MQGGVVGLVTISPQVDVVLLEANFRLSDLVYLPHHPPSAHGEVDMLCINPIFAHRTRELLAGSQRLLGKAVLYYALPPGQPPPDMLEVLQQVCGWAPVSLCGMREGAWRGAAADGAVTRRHAKRACRGKAAQPMSLLTTQPTTHHTCTHMMAIGASPPPARA